MLKNFEQLVKSVKNVEETKKVAVVCAHDAHTLEAVVRAEKEGLIDSVLLGNADQIKTILFELGHVKPDDTIVETASDQEAAVKAVEQVREGKVDFLMKGKLQTADLLKAVVDKEKGLRRVVLYHICLSMNCRTITSF